MIKEKLRSIAQTSLLVLVIMCAGCLTPVYASIDASKSAACSGIGIVDSGGCGSGSDARVTSLTGTIVNLLSLVVGIVAVIMIIVSGLRYITSGGDSNKVSGAKSALIYALVGIVIVALAQTIVRFVLTAVK